MNISFIMWCRTEDKDGKIKTSILIGRGIEQERSIPMLEDSLSK